METVITKSASGAAGKPGEGTAQAKAPAANGAVDKKNLTPAGVSSLLTSAFAEPEPAAKPAPKTEGEEVQPVAEGDEQGEPAPIIEGEEKQGEEVHAGGEGEAGAGAAGTLPEHLEAELAQWEEQGGELPAPLQKLVEKRINKLVGEREQHKQRADTAEAEVQRLSGELESARSSAPAGVAAGVMNEKSLNDQIRASEKFKADARAYVGGYADDAITKRVEDHMKAHGLDDKGLKRQLDEVNDWLTTTAPGMRADLKKFKADEAAFTPVVKSRFPTLSNPLTPEGKLAAEINRLMPELSTRTPSHELARAIYVLGFTAYDHLSAASKEGDILATLRTALKKSVPVTATGTSRPAALPGKAPAKVPVGGLPARAPNVGRKDAQAEQASETLKAAATAENMTAALKMSLK